MTKATMQGLGVVLILCYLTGCRAHQPRDEVVVSDSADARLDQALRIGEDGAAEANSQFSTILAILPTRSGKLWVLDGQISSGVRLPRLRIFDAEGRYVRDVGRAGEGPGEFLDPTGLAELVDGRVALRSEQPVSMVSVYSSDGEFASRWKLPLGTRWLVGGADPIAVDGEGLVWLPTTAGRPRLNRPRPFYLRVDSFGNVIDSIPFPLLPDVKREDITFTQKASSGETRTATTTMPFQAGAIWAWSPQGSFITARTDQYHLNVVPWRLGHDTITLARTIGAIQISDGERESAREDLVKEISARRGDASAIPDLPRFKPILQGVHVAPDGRVLVHVARPARKVGTTWITPYDLDIFGAGGVYQGRIIQPEEFTVWQLMADTLWGVAVDADGVESVRRYRVTWLNHP